VSEFRTLPRASDVTPGQMQPVEGDDVQIRMP